VEFSGRLRSELPNAQKTSARILPSKLSLMRNSQ
jgi:hypothetical protein